MLMPRDLQLAPFLACRQSQKLQVHVLSRSGTNAKAEIDQLASFSFPAKCWNGKAYVLHRPQCEERQYRPQTLVSFEFPA